MKSFSASLGTRLTLASFWLSIIGIGTHANGAATNGYITAVLRSGCANAPTPPPPVGSTTVGSNYVIMTVADADPLDFGNARAVVTDAIFESLMPLYCNLPKTANNCVGNSVQWNIITYDANGNSRISGCAASGCQSHSCSGFESGPPEIVVQPADRSVNSGQSATFSVEVSGATPLYYQWVFNGTNILVGATNRTLLLPSAQTNHAGTYQVQVSNSLGSTNSRLATLTVNSGPAAIHGYIAAVLRSGCANSPTPPPPVGGTAVGTNYVIMTVADADPMDFEQARTLVSDAAFESLMPLYCNLPRTTNNCAGNSVQWNIITYDINGNPRISGCAASGCQYHSCSGFESGPPGIVIQPADRSVNSGQSATFSVVASGSVPLYYQWVFNGTNILVGATNQTLVLPNAQTNHAGTYQVQVSNSLGSTNSRLATLTVNPGPAATHGYITAVLRSGCANAPTPPPPVGGTAVGSNYVIMTVADADPMDFEQARALVTDATFESLMPLYCNLPRTTNNCVGNFVQWNIITYDINGNPRISGCAASGCQYRSCGAESAQTRSPALKISPGTNSVGLSWSTMACDFVLETTADMIHWHPVNQPATTNFDTISVQVPLQGNNPLFQLRHR